MQPAKVIVCAGRRIDPIDISTPRFPLSQAEAVCQRVEAVFRQERVTGAWSVRRRAGRI